MVSHTHNKYFTNKKHKTDISMLLIYLFYAVQTAGWVENVFKNPSTHSPARHFPSKSAFREAAWQQELQWMDSTR